MRRIVRIITLGGVVGALLTGSVLAGIVIDPLEGSSHRELPPSTRSDSDPDSDSDSDSRPIPSLPEHAAHSAGPPFEQDHELDTQEVADLASQAIELDLGGRLPDGDFLVGASRATLHPDPETFGEAGDQWQREGCTAVEDGEFDDDPDHFVASVADLRGWPAASPDCIYLGGFGIGPTRPAADVGPGGVWVRSIAISNGETAFVYQIADTVGWFARYDQLVCETDDCGILDVRHRIAEDTGLPVDHVITGSTHTHAGADTYGGWGGIPQWYRAQLRDATIAGAKQALLNLQPATINVGEVHLRDRNGERRDTYYSTADTGATWLQAVDRRGRAIATWSTFAGHPTIVSDNILHADWPGATARRFEALFGGVGLMFEGGLGNVSISGTGSGSDAERAEATGIAVADDVATSIAHDAFTLSSNVLDAAVQTVAHPAMTNPGLTTLATAGLFDREFTPGTPGAGVPSVYHWSKNGEASTSGEDVDEPSSPAYANGCTSTGPTVNTTAGAHRIGELAVAFAPGEIFSNLAEVVKEEADASAVTMVLGQTNDALGYIIQSFEFDALANAATEYGTQTHEYEEVFSIDRCFGDHVLETLLESTGDLAFR